MKHDPTTGRARKDDSTKPWLELLPPRALILVGRVLTMGARKYTPNNWRLVMAARDKSLRSGTDRYLAAALRHLLAHMGGERLDPESGEPHLAHAVCCLLFILEHESAPPSR
jgi:hypothetical protein